MKLVFVLIILSLLILNIALIIASLGSQRWSVIDSNKNFSLYYCIDCEDLQHDWNFECLARSSCSTTLKQNDCSLYSDLYKASYAYLILEFASLLMSILFFEKLLLIITNDDIGSKISIIGISISMLVFHVAGTIFWFGLSAAGTTCDTPSTNTKPSVCYSTGPKLAISNCVLMFVTITLFISVFCRAESSDAKSVLHCKFLGVSGKKWS